MAKFKQEVLEKMKTNPDLFAVVSKVMGVLPASLPMIISRNGNSVNQYSVVTAVAEFLGQDPEELLEEEPEVKDTAA